MRRLIESIFFTLLLLLFCVVAQAQDSSQGVVPSQSELFPEEYSKSIIYYLADEKLQGRAPGTQGSELARAFVVEELRKCGLEVECQGDGYVNVIGKIKGLDTTSYVIIGAHYDHHGIRPVKGSADTVARIHPGADDNASGVAALLQLARAVSLSGRVPQRNLLFCAWDGEERGMKGSYDFVAKRISHPEQVALYMNFDMVGRTKDPANPAVTFAWDGHCENLEQLCLESAKRIEQPFTVVYDKRMEYGKGGSDYAPFSARKIPFVAWMEDELHEDYHKPGDTPDKICWVKLRKTIELAYIILSEFIY